LAEIFSKLGTRKVRPERSRQRSRQRFSPTPSPSGGAHSSHGLLSLTPFAVPSIDESQYLVPQMGVLTTPTGQMAVAVAAPAHIGVVRRRN
jgi:hypothetical protein